MIADFGFVSPTRWFLRFQFRRFHETARKQVIVIALVFVFSVGGSASVAWIAGVPQPHLTDEFSYLLAADTFAHGRLTNQTHPMWIHLESLHVIQQPTYMSKYPPAQGLVLAAGQVVAGQPIVGVWLSFALMCAAICWMLYAWVPPRWAVVGAALAIMNPQLGVASYWAQSYWGGAVAATGGALMLGGFRRLTRHPSWLTTLAVGVGLAILANSRPYEGLFLSLAVGVFLIMWMRSKQGPTLSMSIRQIIIPILIVVGLTATAMAYYNYRVAGNAFRLPYQIHEEAYAVAPLFLWQSPRLTPEYRHEPIREYHTKYVRYGYSRQLSIAGFLEKAWTVTLTLNRHYLNVFILPIIAVLPLFFRWALHSRWPRFSLFTCALVLGALLVEVHWAVHYIAPITALIYFLAVSAIRWCRWQNKTFGRLLLAAVLSLATLALITSLHARIRLNEPLLWSSQRGHILADFRRKTGQHLLLVRYHSHSRHPVWEYNEANIDSAKVISARSMDERQNCKLMQYFSDRHIWSLDISGDPSKPQVKISRMDSCR